MADPGPDRLTGSGPPGHRAVTPRRARTHPALLLVAILLWVLAAPAGVAAGITLARHGQGAAGPAGRPLAAERIDTGQVPLAIRRVPSTGQPPNAAAEESLVAAVVADLQTFWADTVPRIANQSFSPLRGGITAVNSAATSGRAPCVNSPAQINGNAYYCPSNDGIVYDSSALVPVLLARYGVAGLVGALAHEFGHAVQARIGPTSEQRTADPQRYPSLLIEAQGDCDAGAFLAWVVAGKAPHIHLGASAMAAATGPLLDFADPVTVTAADAAAHGLSLDRLTSVLVGYRNGAGACHAMTMDSLHPTLGQVPLPPGGAAALATPRYPSTARVLSAARASIAHFTGSPAGGASADPAALSAASPYGQFAQATVLALGVGRQQNAGVDVADNAAGAACFAGAWVASVYGHAKPGALGSWPGDADEGLNAVRSRPGATFADAAGYADGFHGGLTACR